MPDELGFDFGDGALRLADQRLHGAPDRQLVIKIISLGIGGHSGTDPLTVEVQSCGDLRAKA